MTWFYAQQCIALLHTVSGPLHKTATKLVLYWVTIHSSYSMGRWWRNTPNLRNDNMSVKLSGLKAFWDKTCVFLERINRCYIQSSLCSLANVQLWDVLNFSTKQSLAEHNLVLNKHSVNTVMFITNLPLKLRKYCFPCFQKTEVRNNLYTMPGQRWSTFKNGLAKNSSLAVHTVLSNTG